MSYHMLRTIEMVGEQWKVGVISHAENSVNGWRTMESGDIKGKIEEVK